MNYNPYSAPQAGPPGIPGMPPMGGGAGAQPWAVGESLSVGWNAFKQNWAVLLFGWLLGAIIGNIPSSICQQIGQGMIQSDPQNNMLAAQLVINTGTFVSWIISSFFTVGAIRMFCAAARGRQPTFGMVFSGFDRFFPMLGASFLTGLAVGLGFVCCIVPGILLALGLSLTSYYVVDAGLGPIEAMKASWAATKGQWGALFVFGLAATGICLGAIIACGLPILVAIPVVYTAFALVFLRISGRAQAEPVGGGGGMAMPLGALGGPAPAGYGAPPGGGYGGGPGFGPPPGGGGYGGPPGGGYGPPGGGAPPGGGYGPPGGGGGYGPPGGGAPPGGGYGPPGGGGGYGR